MGRSKGDGAPRAKKSGKFILLIYALALVSYFLPAVQIDFKPAGIKTWSPHQIARPLELQVKNLIERSGKKSPVMPDFDFFDYLKKILPENQQVRTENKKMPWILILGISIPIALIVCYLALILNLFLSPFNAYKISRKLAWISAVTSGYGFCALFYLNSEMSKRLGEKFGAAKGLLSSISKPLALDIQLMPTYGFYLLLSVCFILYFRYVFRKR